MGIREQVNKTPGVVIGVISAVIVGAVVITYMTSRNDGAVVVSKMYYSDDEGKTYFADDTNKIYPFDHGGKDACRAYVFQESGQPFVGYLSRYTESARRTLLSQEGSNSASTNADALAQARREIEVKRPGETKWVSAFSTDGEKVAAVRAPDGGMLHEVLP